MDRLYFLTGLYLSVPSLLPASRPGRSFWEALLSVGCCSHLVFIPRGTVEFSFLCYVLFFFFFCNRKGCTVISLSAAAEAHCFICLYYYCYFLKTNAFGNSIFISQHLSFLLAGHQQLRRCHKTMEGSKCTAACFT